MIYGQISLVILLIGLCGASAFVALRSMNKADAITRDNLKLLNSVANLQQIYDGLSAKFQAFDSENYIKLSARLAVNDGEILSLQQKNAATVSALEQMNKRFASWERTETKNARRAASGGENAQVETPADSETDTLARLVAEGKAVPFSPPGAFVAHQPKKSLRLRQG